VSAAASRQTRALVAALLWLAAVGGCGVLLVQLAALDGQIELEKDMRDDVRKEMGTYALRDPARWRADQRRVDARIAALERRRRVVLGLDLALAALALSPLALVFRRPRERRGSRG